MEKSPYLTLKLQLYPNGKMKHLMDRSIEISGYVYNAFIYVGRYYRKNYNRFPSKNDLRGLCTKFWKNCPWMHDVANNCFFECADNAIRSLKTCQENYKRHRGDQLPKYRKREDFTAFGHISCTNFHLNNKYEEGKLKRTLHLCKIGEIRARNNQAEPQGMPKTCHIKREMVGNHHEYFATISYLVDGSYSNDEYDLEQYKRNPQGIDIGISNIVTLSNGVQYPNQKFQRTSQKYIEKYHRQLSHSVPYSNLNSARASNFVS